jgi:hypothetical protein
MPRPSLQRKHRAGRSWLKLITLGGGRGVGSEPNINCKSLMTSRLFTLPHARVWARGKSDSTACSALKQRKAFIQME